jgi:hypothetical protein
MVNADAAMEVNMDIDNILEKELAKLVAIQGADKAIGRAAKKLPTVAFRQTVVREESLEDAVRAAHTAAKGSPGFKELLENPENIAGPAVFAIIGSGVKNMNPAVICATFEYVDDNATKIHIVGSAKEGLIKQKTAEKAVMRVAKGLCRGDS